MGKNNGTTTWLHAAIEVLSFIKNGNGKMYNNIMESNKRLMALLDYLKVNPHEVERFNQCLNCRKIEECNILADIILHGDKRQVEVIYGSIGNDSNYTEIVERSDNYEKI